MKKLRVLLIQGGPSSEHAISIQSGKNILASLDPAKYICTVATISRKNIWKFGTKSYTQDDALRYIKRQKFDIAYIALHGKFGEDGTLQTLLDSINQPYTGSNPEASMLAMNKAASCALFQYNGLDVPVFFQIKAESEVNGLHLAFPWVIKPCHGGSSVGVVMVKNMKEAKKAVKNIFDADDTAIIQQRIIGREFTCGVLDGDDVELLALPPTEIIPIKGDFFDFKSKYVKNGSHEVTPPDAPSLLIIKIQETALKTHNILGLSGMSRTDFVFDGVKLFVLETNTLPGMTRTSLLPQAAAAVGISFPSLLDRIIQNAVNPKKSERFLGFCND